MYGFVILLGFILYWLLYPYKTLDVFVQPMPVEKQEYSVGGTVSYDVHFCRHVSIAGTVEKYLVRDDIEEYSDIFLMQQTSRFPVSTNCSASNPDIAVVQNNTIPDHIYTGRYHIRVVVEYKMNPLRTIKKEYNTESFNVVE